MHVLQKDSFKMFSYKRISETLTKVIVDDGTRCFAAGSNVSKAFARHFGWIMSVEPEFNELHKTIVNGITQHLVPCIDDTVAYSLDFPVTHDELYYTLLKLCDENIIFHGFPIYS